MDLGAVRWSLKTRQRGWRYEDTLALWRAADELEFETVFVNDHLYGSTLEAWTTLTAMLAQTTRVRGGTLATSNSFRHPTILAKMAATVDIMSGGRLVLGLGAGNEAEEYRTFGLPFPSARERVERLDEACRILQLAWSGERFDFDGQHYSLVDAAFLPPPASPPRLIIGVKGELALRVAVRHADEWNWNRSNAVTGEFFVCMDRLDRACEVEGRDPSSLPRGLGFRNLHPRSAFDEVAFREVVSTIAACIRRGARHVVLTVGDPPEARIDDELSFYRDRLIPEVLAAV